MANDNDVKIFDDTVNLSDFVPFDTETATAMMQQVAQEKQNGNLGKARRMGARLAYRTGSGRLVLRRKHSRFITG